MPGSFHVYLLRENTEHTNKAKREHLLRLRVYHLPCPLQQAQLCIAHVPPNKLLKNVFGPVSPRWEISRMKWGTSYIYKLSRNFSAWRAKKRVKWIYIYIYVFVWCAYMYIHLFIYNLFTVIYVWCVYMCIDIYWCCHLYIYIHTQCMYTYIYICINSVDI